MMYDTLHSFKLAYFNDFSSSRRGRPRNSYPQMNDFDANLIREFRTRPAFYDRNNPRFKDKVFTAREWQEISNKLGYDVSLLKDRMLQLRNRYNLEKRRIEQLREENPGTAVDSPWPLFDHLHFLSEHIRARRSYKRMLSSAAPQHATRMDLPSGASNSSSNGGGDDADENGLPQLSLHAAAAAAGFPNGYLPVRVKMENVDDAEPNSNGSETAGMNGNMPTLHMQAFHQHQQQQQQQQLQEREQHKQQQQNDTDADESESQSVTDNVAFLAAQSAAMLNNKQYAYAQHQQQQQLQLQQQQLQQRLHPSAPPPLKIRRIDSLRAGIANTWVPVPQQQQQQQYNHHHSPQKRHSHSNSSVHTNSSHLNALRSASTKSKAAPTYATTPREQKYAAFGDFVASSLLDLPASTAMHLIEKFTTEVVKVLIENDEAIENEKNSAKTAAAVAAACNGLVSGTAN